MKINYTKLIFKKDPDRMISRLIKNKVNFFIRRSSDITEIILDDVNFMFISGENFPNNKLFLFNSVRKDAVKWLQNRPHIDMPPEFGSINHNINYDDNNGKIAGTDLNHAYWRIAFVMGLISEKTYKNGLGEGCKALRLATLSTLGREKKFTSYIEGVPFEDFVTQKENKLLKQIFEYIRLSCFNMMHDLAMLLEKDFESWNTDCIYYRDTLSNRELVHSFFDKRSMGHKQLEYFEDGDNDAVLPLN